MVAPALVVLVVAAGCTSSPSQPPSSTRSSASGASPSTAAFGYQPTIDPANFVSVVDNPYFPLKPGTTYVYQGVRDGQSQRDTVVVSSQTKAILGVPCVVVKDTAMHAGELIEQTEDWYTQDKQGNVWY